MRENDEPPYYANMRRYGYPPGYKHHGTNVGNILITLSGPNFVLQKLD